MDTGTRVGYTTIIDTRSCFGSGIPPEEQEGEQSHDSRAWILGLDLVLFAVHPNHTTTPAFFLQLFRSHRIELFTPPRS